MSDSSTHGMRPYALITGASSGIGYELARQFAANGFDVLMVAEDAAIDAAAAAIGVDGAAEALRADLREPEEVERVWARVRATGRPLSAAAINAGVGSGGAFVTSPLSRDLDVVRLNVTSTVHLAKLVLADMVARNEGRVLFTSSVAATMPAPYNATYAASKAFVQSFAEAVRREVADAGVTVTALMPGPTDTEFFERAGLEGSKIDEGHKDDAADVARDGFEALMAGKDHVVAGSARNRMQAGLGKVLPEKITAVVHGVQSKPPGTE